MDNDNGNCNTIPTLRARMIATNPNLGTAENQDRWWLLGTTGCHLCDIAEHLLSQFQAVPVSYTHLTLPTTPYV